MREHFLSFVWQHKLYDPTRLLTTDGRQITVLDPGKLNDDSGPDFKEAKLSIDRVIWSGHVEIHVRSSDWYKHKHETDPAYNSVILHVVYEADVDINRSGGGVIPCLELRPIMRPEYYEKYSALRENITHLPCQAHIRHVRDITIQCTLQRMAVERYEERVLELLDRLKQLRGNWPQMILERFARGMGFRVNGFSMEQVARQTPLRVLMKEAHEQANVEALLFGQAHLLQQKDDHFAEKLSGRYEYLRSKHDLDPLTPGQFKFLRTRPSNFPTVRLAQLAAVIHGHPHFCHQLLEVTSIASWRQIFDIHVNEYWHDHYDFGKRTERRSDRRLSIRSQDLLAINVLVPLQMAYARYLGSAERKEIALNILSSLNKENNKLIRMWSEHGVRPKSALDTQGMIHLQHHYCREHKCLKCPVGHEIIRDL